MTRHAHTFPLGPLTPEDFPAGIYLASYRTHKYKPYWEQEKIVLEYVIVEPAAYAGLFVSLYMTCKEDHNKRPSKQSNYYKLWVRVNGGPPQRGQRMTPSIFRGYWNVVVGWGEDKKTKEPTIPKIVELIERVAGGPAV
jgi:hypothetical protein